MLSPVATKSKRQTNKGWPESPGSVFMREALGRPGSHRANFV